MGSALGCLGAAALSRVLSAFVFNVSPSDPVTMGAAVLILGMVALLASALPAGRVARLNCVDVLRYERGAGDRIDPALIP